MSDKHWWSKKRKKMPLWFKNCQNVKKTEGFKPLMSLDNGSSFRSTGSLVRIVNKASSIRSLSSPAKSLTSTSSECFIDGENISPEIKIQNSFTDYRIAPSPPSSPIDQTLELYLKDYRMENIENENFDAKTHDYANDKDFQNHLAIFALKCGRRIENLMNEEKWINNLW